MIELGYQGLRKLDREKVWGGSYIGDNDIPRDNTLLAQVVEELGREADGFCARLCIVTIPDGTSFTVEEYDGNEWVSETHRIWHGECGDD